MDTWIPSRELTYPTWGSSENHLQNAIFGGYGLVPWRIFFPTVSWGWIFKWTGVEVDHVIFRDLLSLVKFISWASCSVNQELWLVIVKEHSQRVYIMFVGAGCGVWIMIDPFSYRQKVDERLQCILKSHKSKSNMIYILNQRHTTMSTNNTPLEFCIYKCFKKKMLIFLCGYIRDIEKHLHFTIYWDLQFSSSFFRISRWVPCTAAVGAFSSEKLDRRNPIQFLSFFY